MRSGQLLTPEDLRQAAYQAVEASDHTQSEVADELGVHRGSVASALHTPGGRYLRLQRRILETLTAYTVEREQSVHFRALRPEHISD